MKGDGKGEARRWEERSGISGAWLVRCVMVATLDCVRFRKPDWGLPM